MKNMGLSKLVLVKPWFLDHPQARYMAHGSEDVLDKAEVFDDIREAVKDSVLVVGTTQRKRHNMPYINPKQAVDDILSYAMQGTVSILFGREDKGLLNDELTFCQLLVTIPSSQAQPSLNVSQAVMVMAYELFSAVYPGQGPALNYATIDEMTGMYTCLKNSLTSLGFKQWNNGDNFMKSLRRVFSRTKLEKRDVATIHKLCGEIDKYVIRVRDEIGKGMKR
jgi:TrmH family RNA methyltransferase